MGLLDLFRSKPTPETFGPLVIKAARARGLDMPMRFEPDQFRIAYGVEFAAVFNLHNAFRDYCAAARGERDNVLTNYLHILTNPEIPSTFDAARAKLRPAMRGKMTEEYVRIAQLMRPDGKDDGPASLPFSADTSMVLAYDTEFSIQLVNRSNLAQWGVTIDAAMAAAIDNLRDVSVSNFEQVIPGVYVGNWGDTYESSRILFPDLVYQLGVGSAPVMMIPTRNRFVVASANSKANLLAMLEFARIAYTEEGRAVSALMYHFEDGRAVAWEPQDAEVLEKQRALALQYLADDYAEQKNQLDALHEKTGVDIFVGSCQVVNTGETGKPSSIAVWTENVDTLLPRVEFVALLSEEDLVNKNKPQFVRWDDLLAASNEPQRCEEAFPERYRVRQFPAREQRAAMPACSLH